MTADTRLIVVLGMHRSGTSALSRSLEALGVDLGRDFHPTRPDNPKGDWEDRRFHGLNEDLLRRLDRSWDDLRLLDPDAVLALSRTDLFPRAVALIHACLRRKAPVGVKDPRFSLLLPFWWAVFQETGVHVSLAVAFRNPLSVARSLYRRDAMSKTNAIWLWTLYNERIAADTLHASRVLVEFDDLVDDPTQQLARVAHLLDLTAEPAALATYCSEFLDPALCHARFTVDDIRADPDCGPRALEMYEELRSQASAPSPSVPVR